MHDVYRQLAERPIVVDLTSFVGVAEPSPKPAPPPQNDELAPVIFDEGVMTWMEREELEWERRRDARAQAMAPFALAGLLIAIVVCVLISR